MSIYALNNVQFLHVENYLQIKTVNWLLEKGAKTHLLNASNLAPLHQAVELGKEQAVQVGYGSLPSLCRWRSMPYAVLGRHSWNANELTQTRKGTKEKQLSMSLLGRTEQNAVSNW